MRLTGSLDLALELFTQIELGADKDAWAGLRAALDLRYPSLACIVQ